MTSLLVTSDRILILQKAPREDWIIKTEIWFSGLYNYKVVRKGTLIKLHFVVSKQVRCGLLFATTLPFLACR